MTIALWRAVTLRLAVNRNSRSQLRSLIYGLILPLTACLPPASTTENALAFTTENVLAVQVGMTSGEIIELFGRPHSVSSSMCGADVGKPWHCTTWKYGNFLEGSYASFTFAHVGSILVLNNYNIDR